MACGGLRGDSEDWIRCYGVCLMCIILVVLSPPSCVYWVEGKGMDRMSRKGINLAFFC